MHPYFRETTPPALVASLANRAPWFCPPAITPRALVPGEVLLLGYESGRGSLWSLALSRPGEVAIDEPAAWRAASSALAGAVPLLWQAGTIPPLAPSAALLSRPVQGGAAVLRGESYGLSFLLAQASSVLELPLPIDLAASATVDGAGRLGPVEGLRQKIEEVLDLAVRVRQLLVAREQADEARRVAPTLEVIACGTTREAVGCALSQAEEAWIARGRDPVGRSRAVTSLFQLAIKDRHLVDQWQPVERAAALALEWPDLTPADRHVLGFARAIAARHRGEVVPLGAFDLEGVPEPRRTQLLAHLVQHAADTGTPDPEETEQLALRRLVRHEDAFPEHLKLLGALGRLAAARGRFEEALDRQLEAAAGWVARPDIKGEVSYPLSECFRLAAGLRLAEGFARAEELLRRAREVASIRAEDEPWVAPVRARALLWLGRIGEARAVLAALPWHKTTAPWGLFSARVAAALGDASVAAWLRDRAREGPEDARLVASTDTLIALDAAVARGDRDGARNAARTLREQQPEICTQLEKASGRDGDEDLDLLARFFPY